MDKVKILLFRIELKWWNSTTKFIHLSKINLIHKIYNKIKKSLVKRFRLDKKSEKILHRKFLAAKILQTEKCRF